MTGVVDSPQTMLVLDLTGVRFLAASGIRVLLETRERAALTETSLGLVHSTRAVNRVLDVLQLTICSRFTRHLPMPLPPMRTSAALCHRKRAYRILAQVAWHDDPTVNQAQK